LKRRLRGAQGKRLCAGQFWSSLIIDPTTAHCPANQKYICMQGAASPTYASKTTRGVALDLSFPRRRIFRFSMYLTSYYLCARPEDHRTIAATTTLALGADYELTNYTSDFPQRQPTLSSICGSELASAPLTNASSRKSEYAGLRRQYGVIANYPCLHLCTHLRV